MPPRAKPASPPSANHIFRNPYEGFGELTSVQVLVQEQLALGKNRLAIESHPGTGKTIAGLYLAYHFNEPTIVFTNSVNINSQWEEQAFDKLSNENNHDIIHLYDRRPKITQNVVENANILIMTGNKYTNLRNAGYDFSRFKTAIYDEAQNFFTPRRMTLLSDLNPDPDFPFVNQILLSATFPNPIRDREHYNIFCTAFNTREPLRPPIDRLITEVPVHYKETIYALLKNSNPAIRDNFLYRVFGSDLKLMFKTPAKMLITTAQAIDQIAKLCDILSILIESNTNDLPLVVCVLRTGSEPSFKFDLSKIDKRTLRDALDHAVNLFNRNNEQRTRHRRCYNDIKQLMRQISNGRAEIDDLTDKFLGGFIPLSSFTSTLRETYHIEISAELQDLCIEYIEMHNVRKEDAGATKTVNGLLRDIMRNNLNNIGVERNKDTRRLIHDSNIILATNNRVEEGFNCEELVLGYFNGVKYNVTARAQLLGRIRRRQSGKHAEFLHNFPRYALFTVVDAYYRRLDTRYDKARNAITRRTSVPIRRDRNGEIVESTAENNITLTRIYNNLYTNNFNYEKQAEMDTRNNYISHNRLEDEAAYNRVHNNVIVPNPNLFYEERQEYEFDLKAIIDYVKDYLDRQDRQNE